MSGDTLYILASLAALLIAFLAGPTLLMARGVLRPKLGADVARSRAPGLAIGLGAGALSATIVIGATLGGPAAVITAFLTLLLMLAAMDMAWRWLPLEWTLALGALGFGAAPLSGDLTTAALGAALGGGVLLALRQSFLILRKVEALGVGDIWLAAALGAFIGPIHIIWLLGAAAGFGLVLHFLARAPTRQRLGVAFGAQLCAVAPIFVAF
ncbi:MAG: prepilin peptidase [Paracoccaceae bacterium]